MKKAVPAGPKYKDPDCMSAFSVAELLVSVVRVEGSNLADEMAVALLANVKNAHAICLKRITNYANSPGSFPEAIFEEVLQVDPIRCASVGDPVLIAALALLA